MTEKKRIAERVMSPTVFDISNYKKISSLKDEQEGGVIYQGSRGQRINNIHLIRDTSLVSNCHWPNEF